MKRLILINLNVAAEADSALQALTCCDIEPLAEAKRNPLSEEASACDEEKLHDSILLTGQ